MSTAFILREELRRCRETAGEDSLTLIEPLRRLARWHCDHRQPDRALPLIREMWTLHKQAFGSTDQRAINDLSWLASLLASSGKPDRAEALLVELVAQLRRDPSTPRHQRAAVWNQLVEVYYHQSKLTEAFQLGREVVALLSDLGQPRQVCDTSACQFQLNRARNNLGALHVSRGEYLDAQRAFAKNLKFARNQNPNDLVVIAQLLSNLAVVARLRGFMGKSERLTIMAIRTCQRSAGKAHPLVAQGLSNLAIYRLQGGRPTSALSLFRKALRIRRLLHPDGHHQVSRSIQQLAEAHLALRNYAAAERLLERVRKRLEQQTPVDEPQLAKTLCRLGYVYLQNNQLGSSQRVFQQACRSQETALGPAHLQLIPTLNGLGKVDAARGQIESAQAYYRRSLAIAEQNLGPDHPDVAPMLISLVDVCLARGQSVEAQPLIQRALAIRESRLGPQHPLIAETLVRFGQIALAQKQPARALQYAVRARQLLQHARECPPLDLADALAVEAEAEIRLDHPHVAEVLSREELQLREQVVGPRNVTLLPAIKRLAVIYMDQRLLEKAGPLLERGLAISEGSLRNRDERCIYFTEHLGQLFVAKQDFDEAGRWMERTVKMAQGRYGANANEVADTLLRFATSLRAAQRETEAEQLELRAIDVRNRGCHVLL